MRLSGDSSTDSASDPKPGASASASAVAVVGDLGDGEPGVQLDLVEAVAGALPDPAHLLVDAFGERVLGGGGVDLPGVDRRVDADDVGRGAGEPQDPW